MTDGKDGSAATRGAHGGRDHGAVAWPHLHAQPCFNRSSSLFRCGERVPAQKSAPGRAPRPARQPTGETGGRPRGAIQHPRQRPVPRLLPLGGRRRPGRRSRRLPLKGAAMAHRKLPPIHPGEILLEEFLTPFGISQYRLAKDMSVPHAGSTRSCVGRGRSPPIRPCAWPDTLGLPSVSG